VSTPELREAPQTDTDRVKIRAALGQGTRFECKTQHVAATQWTPEREARRQALHAPNPEHVRVLRAGIAEFRALLEQRSAARRT